MQPSSHQEQFTECEQREQMSPLVDQPQIMGLHVTKLSLDDAEGMLDLCTDLGNNPIDVFVHGVGLPLWGTLHMTPQSLPSLLKAASC